MCVPWLPSSRTASILALMWSFSKTSRYSRMKTLDAKDTRFCSAQLWGRLSRHSRPPMDRATGSPARGRRVERRRVERRRVNEDTVEAIQVKIRILIIIIIKSLLDAT